MLALEFEEDIAGQRFAFAGRFAGWPFFLLGAGPEEHVRDRGGEIVERLDDAHYLVVGSKPRKGRAAAVKRAEKLRANGGGPRQLCERDLLHLLRPRLAGRSFLLAGGFSGGLDIDGPAALVEAAGARVAEPSDESVDFAVVGERRAKGKAAALRRIAEMRANGRHVQRLGEEEFLELLALVSSPGKGDFDVRALTVQLRTVVDPKKVGRAIQMLKKESFQLFAEATESSLGGVVRSQTYADTFYACWVESDGRYGCFDDDVSHCWGQQGGLCKHSLVLLIGLAAEGEITPRQALAWAMATQKKGASEDKERSAELILRYKGAAAGEIDWRPTETVPEDYYAL